MEYQKGSYDPANKETTRSNDTGKRELDRSAYSMATCAPACPSRAQTEKNTPGNGSDNPVKRVVTKCFSPDAGDPENMKLAGYGSGDESTDYDTRNYHECPVNL
jgi:hypothetical protein